ncbi:DddA-like double-stranded DNA deaminase toxin [Streptomyces zaomyceticus]|uniref:Polymorphic toxin-type HINT domain-containing protein n=1 Tax=Streptomyces zaomyceticus TaxID=68286 RepID=A0ABZ1LN96_9ACTN|nr:polymorphic toxin-type HINT domain-containing protein [Streptomyces zaomyceticus]
MAAAEEAAAPVNVRELAVSYWETGGPGLKLAAEKALLGGEEAMQKFIAEAEAIQFDDNRVEVARLAMTGGPGVRRDAKAAMRQTSAELETFLLYGYEAPLDEDRRVDISRMAMLERPGVRDAAKQALLGTFADREDFLASGQYQARKDDNRVDVARLAMTGGPNVRTAAKVALRGTPDDIVEFLEVGQFTARNRDQEHASIAELIKQAQEAAKQAADATKAAEESSAKSVEASTLAKEAAQKAALETAAAKDDANTAAVKATQAANAARAAAEAAQEAIGSANAANRAARRAALAAAQTASAAAAAADSANKAYSAAIAAAKDAGKAGAAREMAKNARAAAQAATTSAAAAGSAGDASAAAAVASQSAKSAAANAITAASAAEQANDHADAAGLHSDEARVAAAQARRHAAAADAAADRSEALARRSATAAYEARDAATSAAAHANKSADYADEAAAHAGDAGTYAAQAQKNAEAAQAAANTAKAAVTKAQSIFALARETENADLLTRTDAAIERARTAKITSESMISASATAQKNALALQGTASALAEEAGRPDVNIQATAAKGRQLAFQAMRMLGPWHQEAAARALSGTDQDVLDYLRTRWKEANHSDTRQRVVELSSQSPYASVRAAAAQALTGTPEQIEAFYRTGQYDAGRDDMRVEVARLSTTGDTSVQAGAKAALADGSSKALATYLKVRQYGDRLTDEKVITARLATTGGPEVQAAAKVALAGPPELIHEFITTGQHMAKRKDNLATNHVHQVQVLIEQGKRVAAKAQEDAYRAAQAAALAKGAQAEADQANSNAQASAAEAEGYKANADASADAAEQSAADAAASAASARNAANQAAQDAEAAENSAAEAEFSAAYARTSAQRAEDSADRARASATAAGKSAAEAEADAKAAWTATRELAEKEIEEALRLAAEERKREEERASRDGKRVCVPHPTRETMAYIMPCAASPGDSVIQSMPEYASDPVFRALIWELSGLADIQECVENPSLSGCVMGLVGVTPWGKLKYLTKISDAIDKARTLRATRKSVGCLVELAEVVPHSFPAGTKVLMADGTSRPIERIQVGDQVSATDPLTDETGPRTVTRTIHTPDDRDFTDVTLTDGSSLTSTSHHPYWSKNDRVWKNASDLTAGDELRTPQNSTATVAAVRNWRGLQDAYDLTVDDLHTYYVTTGTTDVLVHNTDEVCHKWVTDIFKELPVYAKLGDKTWGKLRDMEGNVIPGTDNDELKMLSSGEGGEYFSKANELLMSSGHELYPRKRLGAYGVASHVEAKYAAFMKEHGIQKAKVVINNNNGVCTKKQNCENAIEAILPEGSELHVYYPSDDSPRILYGRRVNP